MSNAEHLIENVIFGMKNGKHAEEVLKEQSNIDMLNDKHTSISAEEVIRIACHVVYSLYDGQFPEV